MNRDFNLITSNWIPVMTVGSNQLNRVGIAEAIENAHRLQAVSAPTPLETAATYRLLLAVLHAAMEVSDEKWKAAWRNGSFAKKEIQDYFDRWNSRFNLFDSKHPFFQDATLKSKLESVSSLRGHLASGADATLFSHNTQQQRLSLLADEATLALLSIQAFGLAGTKGSGTSFTDAPCARGMVLFVEGSSLFETLLMNLYERDLTQYRLRRTDNDRPAWEMDDPFLDDPRRPYGLLDHWTWHNRRVRLLLDEQHPDRLTVSEMMYDIGLRASDTTKLSVRDVFNPLHYWRVSSRKNADDSSKTRSHSPLYFEREKALWRDSAVLFRVGNTRNDDADKPPAAIEQIQQFAQEGLLSWSHTFQLLAFGACTKSGQDKTYFYRQEALPLPVSILRPDDASIIGALGEALGAADRTKEVLVAAIFSLARLLLEPTLASSELESKPQKEEKQRINALSQSWEVERRYWNDIEPYFHRFIRDLPDQSASALETWKQAVRQAAIAAFNQAQSYIGNDLRAQRAAAVASQTFNRGLAAALGKANHSDSSSQEGTEDETT